MNIDERGEIATEQLRAAVGPLDTDSMLTALKRTRTRRAGARVAMTVVAALAALVAWHDVSGARSDDLRPVGPLGLHSNGVIVVHGDGYSKVRQRGSEGDRLSYLPTAGPGSDLSWAPDGGELAYEARGELRVADVSTAHERPLTSCHRCGFAWSPDGRLMAVTVHSRLELLDLDTSDVTLIPTPGLTDVGQPTWAPTATRLAFTARGPSGRGLYVVDRDGSGLTLLWSARGLRVIGPFDPAWSPEGDTIAFIDSTPYDEDRPFRAAFDLRITTIETDGSDLRKLADIGSCACLGFALGLTWSPDATTLAVNTLTEHGAGLHEINADGSRLRLVSPGERPDRLAAGSTLVTRLQQRSRTPLSPDGGLRRPDR